MRRIDISFPLVVILFLFLQVMHIAAAMEINSRLLPNLKTLHSTLHSKVEYLLVQIELRHLFFATFVCNVLSSSFLFIFFY